jgi:MFS family permease
MIPAVLRSEPQFRLLFAGQALSALGDRITFVALPFAVLAIGGDAADIGVVLAAAALPFAAFALLGGVWADRLPRHRVMLASDLVRLATQATAAVLLLTGTAEVWHLAALMAVFGTADAFFQPAFVGLMPAVVSPERLQEANALRGFSQSSSLIAGPALAGLLVAALGPGAAIAFDAGTFAISALALARLRPAVVERVIEADPGLVAQLRAGLAEVGSRPWVVAFLAAMCAYHVVVLPAVFILGPVLAERELGGASDWAVVVAAFGAGSIVGDLVVLRLKPSRPLLVAGCAFVVASTQAAIVGSGLPIGGIAALEAVTGIAVSVGFTLWETTLQEQIPEHALSRVSSWDYLVTTGLMPVGFALAGPLEAALGLQGALLAETIVGVPAACCVLLVPAVRRMGRGRPVAAPA